MLFKHGPQPALTSSVELKKLGIQDQQSLMKALKEELQNLLAFSTSIFKAGLCFTAGQQDTDVAPCRKVPLGLRSQIVL